MSSYHCWHQLVCLFLNFAAIVCTLLVILTSLAIQYGLPSPIPDLLSNGTAEVDDAYPTPISPSPWIYVTWLVIFVWMLMWSMHSLVAICRKFSGAPVYVSPTLIHTPMLLFSFAVCGATVTWFCVYDHEYITTATLLAACITVFAWTAYIVSVYGLHVALPRLKKAERMKEAWLHRILVQNGLAALGMWAFHVTMFNLCTALIHNPDLSLGREISAVISLSAIAFFLIVFLILDVSVLDRFTRYTFLHYLVPIVVLCSAIFRQDTWASDSVVFILLATLVALSFLAVMLKAACVSCRVMAGNQEVLEPDILDDNQQSYYVSSASSMGQINEGNFLLRQ